MTHLHGIGRVMGIYLLAIVPFSFVLYGMAVYGLSIVSSTIVCFSPTLIVCYERLASLRFCIMSLPSCGVLIDIPSGYVCSNVSVFAMGYDVLSF